MEINRCFGCMEALHGYPCPHCGYDPHKYKTLDYALRPGTILNGKYLVGKVLGQGGFGITYVGWDLALERKVAIKEYFPSGQVSRHSSGGSTLQWYSTEQAWTAQNSGKEMFLKEARKMSRVDDIVQVVGVRDLFQENNTAYIVMNFVEGETLKERMKKTGPLPWEEAKKIFLPVIEAMEQVHQTGLIHRDLSPDNLMLEPKGRVKILDLGAAKDLKINSGASSMQVAKSGFSPLEQYTQRGGSGPWTDVYALAATMYYTLTGVLPPSAVDRMDNDTIRWDLPQLTALPKGVTRALQKAMIVSPQKRTQTMAQFHEELKMQEKTASSRPRKPRKVIAAAAAILAAAAVILAAAVLVGAVKAHSGVAVEDVITFGTYEQDGNTQNGKEDIEWLVLDKQDGKALLLSRYALDAMAYHEEFQTFTWGTSMVRRWLNSDFMDMAFSTEEQNGILTTAVVTGTQGESTSDKVFLLSKSEVEQYLNTTEQRQCMPTSYAEAQGVVTKDQNCLWWIRNLDRGYMYISCVRSTGDYELKCINSEDCAIRPAIWVSLDQISGS